MYMNTCAHHNIIHLHNSLNGYVATIMNLKFVQGKRWGTTYHFTTWKMRHENDEKWDMKMKQLIWKISHVYSMYIHVLFSIIIIMGQFWLVKMHMYKYITLQAVYA